MLRGASAWMLVKLGLVRRLLCHAVMDRTLRSTAPRRLASPLLAAALTGFSMVGCGAPDPVAPVITPDPSGNVVLTPPATQAEGWQLGTPSFDLAPGQELQQCFFFDVPYDEPVFVKHIEIAQNAGTHHMNIFRVRTIHDLDGSDGEMVADGQCWKPQNWSDWPLVVNSQNEGHVELNLPDGVAHRFEAREKLMLQTHYVNARTQETPGVGKVLVNFDRADPAAVRAELGTAFATNQSLRICPGDVSKTFETTCRFAKETAVTIFGANGHFHSRGRRFTMSVFDPTGDEAAAPFYETTAWNEPLFARNIGVTVPAQGGIRYTCEFAVQPNDCGDPTDGCCFTFGGKVEFQEHCNAFVYYYPRRADTDVNCF
jgi:hypothetical protein